MPAALLDFDGLILQTEASGYAVLRALFAARGVEYRLDEYLQIVGTTNEVLDPFDLLARRTGRTEERAALVAERAAVEDRLNAALSPLPGVVALLDQAATLGWSLAVVSSSTHDWVERHLRHVGLHDRLRSRICRGDAPRAKPAPDLYLEALRRLGLSARDAVAFEDSYNGSIAAVRAGIRCIAVPHALTRGQDFSHCERIVASLSEIDLASLRD